MPKPILVVLRLSIDEDMGTDMKFGTRYPRSLKKTFSDARVILAPEVGFLGCGADGMFSGPHPVVSDDVLDVLVLSTIVRLFR